MKTYRVLVIVLSLLVVWLGYLALFAKKPASQPASEPPKEIARTNTVERWRTNTVERWRTNTVELWRTNTIELWHTNTLPPEIREVPAQLSAQARQAAVAGYKYLNAPLLSDESSKLHKASPLAVKVVLAAGAESLLKEGAATVKKDAEAVLRARNIPVAETSPYQLSLTITPLWRTDVPRVALLGFQLELSEKVALQRQGDCLAGEGAAWSSTTSKMVAMGAVKAELKALLEQQLGRFCSDYLKAKETEKTVESRIPVVPADFPSAAN